MCPHARPSIYRVWIEEGSQITTGTAFAIKAPNLVASASHVVRGKDLKGARLLSSLFQRRSFRFRIVAEDGEADLALLRLEDPDPDFSPLTICSTPTVSGQDVWAMGYPPTHFGSQQVQLERHMAHLAVCPCTIVPALPLRDTASSGDLLFVRPRLYPGMSGTPILDLEDRVVGVLVKTVNREHGPRWLDTDLSICVRSLRLAQLLQGFEEARPPEPNSSRAYAQNGGGRGWHVFFRWWAFFRRR